MQRVVSSIIEGAKASLERLGLDYVDVLFAHRPDESGAFTLRALHFSAETRR